jgi:hypothetical protein
MVIDQRSLHPLDETLMHQVPWPFHYAGTSDHRFFDRHWFAGADREGQVGMVAGMAFYKNMGVCDGFLCLQQGDQQHNMRFSRALGEDFVLTAVGGLEVVIEEPFKRLTLRLDGSDSPMSADLTFEAGYEPYCEPHYTDSRGGRVGQEITRYYQLGSWSGWVDLGNGRIEASNWWGDRDHSWGVRPGVGGFDRSVADPGATTSATPSPPLPMLHVSLIFEHDDMCVAVGQREDADGKRTFWDGEAVTKSGERIGVADSTFDFRFHPGTRQYDQVDARVTLANGRQLDLIITPFLHAWAYAGTGYDGGYRDGKGLGAWRGDVAEHDVYEHADREVVLLDGEPTPTGHREQFANIAVDGTSLIGYCAVMTRGSLPRHGLA